MRVTAMLRGVRFVCVSAGALDVYEIPDIIINNPFDNRQLSKESLGNAD
jgi:hypothetical protein